MKTMKMKTFMLTDVHVALVNHLRPYGNKSYLSDIHEIVTGESIGRTGDKRNCLSTEEINEYMKLHKETAVALQVIVSAKSFEPGVYGCEEFGNRWHRVDLTTKLFKKNPGLAEKLLKS